MHKYKWVFKNHLWCHWVTFEGSNPLPKLFKDLVETTLVIPNNITHTQRKPSNTWTELFTGHTQKFQLWGYECSMFYLREQMPWTDVSHLHYFYCPWLRCLLLSADLAQSEGNIWHGTEHRYPKASRSSGVSFPQWEEQWTLLVV